MIYKDFLITNEIDYDLDPPMRVWTAYQQEWDEYSSAYVWVYIRGTADGSLDGCKTNIDDLAEEGHL